MTPGQFRAVIPAFSSTTAWPDTTIQAVLNRSALFIGATEWGTLVDEATAHWTADRLVTDAVLANPLSARSGDETMKQVGREMIQRDAMIILSNMRDPYLKTAYGRWYNELVSMRFGGSTVAV